MKKSENTAIWYTQAIVSMKSISKKDKEKRRFFFYLHNSSFCMQKIRQINRIKVVFICFFFFLWIISIYTMRTIWYSNVVRLQWVRELSHNMMSCGVSDNNNNNNTKWFGYSRRNEILSLSLWLGECVFVCVWGAR